MLKIFSFIYEKEMHIHCLKKTKYGFFDYYIVTLARYISCWQMFSNIFITHTLPQHKIIIMALTFNEKEKCLNEKIEKWNQKINLISCNYVSESNVKKKVQFQLFLFLSWISLQFMLSSNSTRMNIGSSSHIRSSDALRIEICVAQWQWNSYFHAATTYFH